MGKPSVSKKKNKIRKPIAKRKTRKEQRVLKRQEKKLNKLNFFSKKKNDRNMKNSLTENKSNEIENFSDNDESIPSDFTDDEIDQIKSKSISVKSSKRKENQQTVKKKKNTTNVIDIAELHRRELASKKQLEKESRKQRIKQLKLDGEEEDRMADRLEKKMKFRFNKSKDKNRAILKCYNDGLDDALGFSFEIIDSFEKPKKKAKNNKNNISEDYDEESINSENYDDDSNDKEIEQDENVNHSEMVSEDNSNADDDDEIDNDSDNDHKDNKYREDIYGRKRDKDGNVITDKNNIKSNKYIPPHQRVVNEQETENEIDAKQIKILELLTRSCKGLLNRLSSPNLHKIAYGIEELYMKNSRNNMNETLIKLLNEALICRTISNERMVQEYMVLIAFLHGQIGNEIGAHFLHTYVKQFDDILTNIESVGIDDKRLNNITLLLSYMYIFKIYDHRLLIEIIDKLVENLCEKTTECLLLIFQSIGFKLRKDDPLAFKQMIMNVQQKIAESPIEIKENLRLKFMIDILNAIKNNNINKIPQFDPELAENLRKQLKSMFRNDKYVVTLNIKMQDLLRVDQVGKWWIIGSAWSGNAMNDEQTSNTFHNANTTNKSGFTDKLLKLAKEQKMNTDERRNIFCIIMSAEDYVDAFEKILHLSMKDQRTIAYVIIHCCLYEKQINPYYAHLALKFCNYNRKYQLAFQFATWDRINDMKTLTKLQIKNLAKFLTQIILNNGLNMSVLKAVNFVQLNTLSCYFMKMVMLDLLLTNDEKTIYQAFERVAKNIKLKDFKNSLRLFTQHFFLKNDCNKLKLNADDVRLLKKRITHIDTILALVDL